MIYELRTLDLRPRSLPEVEKRFAEAYEKRKQYSRLGAFWHTEIGPLNQIVQIWPYEDLAHRDRVHAEIAKTTDCTPDISDFVMNDQSDIMVPAAFSPPLQVGKIGPYFEMRIYTARDAHQLTVVLKNWEPAVKERVKLGPVLGIWHTQLGALHKLVHIWPYTSLDQRSQIRDQARAKGVWPPVPTAEQKTFLSQENKILLPAAFSPVQ